MTKDMEALHTKSRVTQMVFLLVLLVFSTIAYLNFAYPILLMNTDKTAEMDFAKCIWEHKSIVPSSWAYATEIILNRIAVLPALLYGLGVGWLRSYEIGIVVCAGIMIFAFYKMSRAFGFSRLVSLVGCLLLVSIYQVIADITLFGYYLYSIVYAVIFLTGCAYVRGGETLLRKVAIVVAFWMGLSSLRMMAWLYLPLLVVTGVLAWRKCLFHDENFCWAGKMLLANALGYLFLCKVIVPVQGVHFAMQHFGVHWSSIVPQSERLWMFLAAGMQIPHNLGDTMCIFSSVCFLLSIVIFFTLFRGRRKEISWRGFAYMLLVSFAGIVVAGILLGISAHFYFFSLQLFVILMLMLWIRFLEKRGLYRTIVLLAAVVVFWGFGYTICHPRIFNVSTQGRWDNMLIGKNDPYIANNEETYAWLCARGVRDIYMTYWDAAPLKVIDNDRYLHIKFLMPIADTGHAENQLKEFQWLIDKEVFRANRNSDGRTYLFLTKRKRDSLNDNWQRILSASVLEAEFGDFVIYSGDNLCDYF